MVAAIRKLPASGYAIEVDGLPKAEFATRETLLQLFATSPGDASDQNL
jgi:hypothetical protein